jgi:hypothetical protein
MDDLNVNIRPVTNADWASIWAILKPIIRTGETYSLPMDTEWDDALAYWLSSDHEVFVAVEDGTTVETTCYLRANPRGGGSHVANCDYMVSSQASGRGVARLCVHIRWITPNPAAF